jgi:tRNA nucleotidyltransferase (CCA-adding enzyme)
MIAAKKLYPDAEMVFPGAQERNLREFFLRSTVYAYNFKRIKDIDLDQVKRLILVDVCQPDRIGPFDAVASRSDVAIHIYDHHPVDESLQPELARIEPVGATVTIFAQIFMEQGICPDPDEATLMMLGLYEDTGSLLFNSTTESDFQAAAFLLSCGANLNTVADFLTQELTSDQVALLHDLIQNHSVLNVNGIDVSIAHASSEHFVGDLAVLSHKLKDMENLDALLVAARMGDRTFLVGRSRIPEVHVGEILAEFGGGGHAFAASGTVRDLTLVQILDQFPGILKKHVNPQWQARHLMSSPVKFVEIDSSIKEARRVLTRYNLNALPVMADGVVDGVITRQTADKAAHHDLSGSAVSEYMNREVDTVAPDASIDTLQEMIVGFGQRIVPVVDRGALVGVITRTDLLRHLVTDGQALTVGFDSQNQHSIKRKQLVKLLQGQLPKQLFALLKDLGKCAEDEGVKAYVVGGFVRDLLLRQKNLDIDVVVEGDGIAFARAFAGNRACRVRAHEKFGTAVIIFPDDFKIDVASTRMEYYVEPGALPNVEHASIKLDLYRRDFTINTLAMSINAGEFGELIDHYQAQKDLRQKAIRVLHNLSFVEDPTRVFRAIRFEQRLGFRLGRHTEALLRSAVRMGFVDKVAGPRVYNELVVIFREPRPLASLQRMAEFGLLGYLHPDLKLIESLASDFEEADRVIHWHDLLYTGQECRSWVVYLFCLLSELPLKSVREFCRRFDLPPKVSRLLCDERKVAHDVQRLLLRRRQKNVIPTNSEIYRWLKPLALETVLYLMARCHSEEIRQWVSNYYAHLRPTTISLNGNDLSRLGIPEGAHYKKILDTLLDARLNGRVTSRDEEIALVKKRFSKHIER